MRRRQLLAFALAGTCCAPVLAQDYPNRPVRLIVGFAPGGATDIVARMIAQGLTQRLGRAVIVENRPGANGTIAAQAVIASAADGYTLFVSASGAITLEPTIRKPRRYDPQQAFTPVAMGARFPFIIVAGNAQPFGTGPELVAAAKAKPGGLSYASAGNGSLNHLGSEYFKMRTGTNIVHVPYKGDGASLTDLIAGTVSFNMLTAPVAIPLVQSGRLKAIAAMDSVRSPSLPEVPTLAEQGMPGFEIGSWIGVFAPVGTPAAIVEKLNREIQAVFTTPEAKQQLASGSMTHDAMTPREFEEMVRRESARWREVAEKAAITLTD